MVTHGLGGQRLALVSSLGALRYDQFVPEPLDSVRYSGRHDSTDDVRTVVVPDGALVPLVAALRRPQRNAHDRDGARRCVAVDADGDRRVLAALDRVARMPSSVDTICDLHARLAGATTRSPGAFRQALTWVSGRSPATARLVPPPSSAIPFLMRDLVAFAERSDVPPMVKVALLHYQFLSIHPFCDANGRVGRVLAAAWTERLASQRPRGIALAALLGRLKDELREHYAELERGRSERYLHTWRALVRAAADLAETCRDLARAATSALVERIGPTHWAGRVAAALLGRPAIDEVALLAAVGDSARTFAAKRRAMEDAGLVVLGESSARPGEWRCPLAIDYWMRADAALDAAAAPLRNLPFRDGTAPATAMAAG